MMWIELPTCNYSGIPVHEVKCPVCGHKETFHTQPPVDCYVCCNKLGYRKENEE